MRQVTTQGQHPNSDILDLGLGHPSNDMLPLDLLREAANTRLAGSDASILQYGAERGDRGFRESVARVLSDSGTSPDRLFVTSGASQALDLLCTLYTQPGDLVITTEPTYHLALKVFRDHGLEVLGLPSDQHGPDPEAVEAAVAGRRPGLLYLVSPFANPSGSTLSRERRQRLLELAETFDFWLVTDEVYRQLSFDAAMPRSPEGGRAISLHSFSKILAPGLRLGWIEGPEAVLQRIEESGLLRSGGGLNPLGAAIVDELLQDEERFSHHLDTLRQRLEERAAALAAALGAHLPQARFEVPDGGYFIWMQLGGVDSEMLLEGANSCGVNYQPGRRFSTSGGLADYFRLSFAHYSPPQLYKAVARLAHAVQSEASR